MNRLRSERLTLNHSGLQFQKFICICNGTVDMFLVLLSYLRREHRINAFPATLTGPWALSAYAIAGLHYKPTLSGLEEDAWFQNVADISVNFALETI